MRSNIQVPLGAPYVASASSRTANPITWPLVSLCLNPTFHRSPDSLLPMLPRYHPETDGPQLCRVRLDSSRHSTGIDSAERLRSSFTVFAQDPTSSSKPKGRYPGGHTASVGSSSESLEPSARASHTWSSGPYKVSTGGADATLQFTSRRTNLHHCFHRCSCYPLCYLPSRSRTRTQSRCSPRRHPSRPVHHKSRWDQSRY